MAQFDINAPKIYLSNGNVLECYPRHTDEINDNKPHSTPVNTREPLLCKYAFLFLENSDLIFSDSRMFLASTNIYNDGMADFREVNPACLGAYLEWWIYKHRFSIDINGRPIWFLGAAPRVGSFCKAADQDGNPHKANLPNYFVSTCESFLDTSKNYSEAQKHCQSFTIQEVIDILRGRHSIEGKARVQSMLEYFKLDNKVQELEKTIESLNSMYSRAKTRVEQLLFEKHYDQLMEYHNTSLFWGKVVQQKEENVKAQRIELRKNLHEGNLSNTEYQRLYTPLKKDAEETRWQWHLFLDMRLHQILGDDYGWLNSSNVDRLFNEQSNKYNENSNR